MSFVKKRDDSPYYYYYWTDDDGVKHGKSLRVKTAIEAEIKKGIEDRKRFAGETDTLVKGVPWVQFRQEFLAAYSGKTLEAYTLAMEHFQRIVKPTVVSALTYNDAKKYKIGLQAYINPKTKKPLKDNSVNLYLRPLHTALREAVRMGYAAKNIFEEIKQINVTKRVPRYHTLEDVQKLKIGARSWPHPDLYPMLMFLLHTGIRKKELLSLKWSAIDLEREVMYLHGSEDFEPKDREEHAIGLHRDLVKILKKRGKEFPLVFHGGNGQRKNEDAVGRLFNRFYKRMGINATGLHINRHTFATQFPGPDHVVQDILGHSDPRTTRRYRHKTDEHIQAVKNFNYTRAR